MPPKLIQTCPLRRATDGDNGNQWFLATDLASFRAWHYITNKHIAYPRQPALQVTTCASQTGSEKCKWVMPTRQLSSASSRLGWWIRSGPHFSKPVLRSTFCDLQSWMSWLCDMLDQHQYNKFSTQATICFLYQWAKLNEAGLGCWINCLEIAS